MRTPPVRREFRGAVYVIPDDVPAELRDDLGAAEARAQPAAPVSMEPWQAAGVESLPTKKVPAELPELPPKVPEELPELDRALQLLGAVCQAGRIKDKHRIELETLLGCAVTQQLAAHWKKHLKEIRRDLAEELKSDPEG